MIYLASPYTDKDPTVMEQRFDQMCRIAGYYMRQGTVVYSPIVHCHPIAIRVDLPRDWAFWQRFDEESVKMAGAVHVIQLPGWEKSKGVAAEVEVAKLAGIPVFYVDPKKLLS
jgi:hypothetical protein